jgi:hypothetical protein
MKFKVNFWEFESGWGRRLDSTEIFDSYEEAEKVKIEFNSQNTEEVVPDWYMLAEGPFPLK